MLSFKEYDIDLALAVLESDINFEISECDEDSSILDEILIEANMILLGDNKSNNESSSDEGNTTESKKSQISIINKIGNFFKLLFEKIVDLIRRAVDTVKISLRKISVNVLKKYGKKNEDIVIPPRYMQNIDTIRKDSEYYEEILKDLITAIKSDNESKLSELDSLLTSTTNQKYNIDKRSTDYIVETKTSMVTGIFDNFIKKLSEFSKYISQLKSAVADKIKKSDNMTEVKRLNRIKGLAVKQINALTSNINRIMSVVASVTVKFTESQKLARARQEKNSKKGATV